MLAAGTDTVPLEKSNTINMSIMADTQAPEELMARFEELGALEAEFEDIEAEISELGLLPLRF